MPLIDCPECGTSISAKAPACPRCGAPATRPRVAPKEGAPTGAIILSLGVGFVILMIIAAGVSSGSSSVPTTTPASSQAITQSNYDLLQQCDDVLSSSKNAGVIISNSWERSGSMTSFQMIVDKSLWDEVPFSSKSGMVDAVACDAVQGDKSMMVEGYVYDNMNHNEIGQYSALTGQFTSEEPTAGQ